VCPHKRPTGVRVRLGFDLTLTLTLTLAHPWGATTCTRKAAAALTRLRVEWMTTQDVGRTGETRRFGGGRHVRQRPRHLEACQRALPPPLLPRASPRARTRWELGSRGSRNAAPCAAAPFQKQLLFFVSTIRAELHPRASSSPPPRGGWRPPCAAASGHSASFTSMIRAQLHSAPSTPSRGSLSVIVSSDRNVLGLGSGLESP